MTRYDRLAQALVAGSAVCATDGGFCHAGYLHRLLLCADGSFHLTFTDRVTIHVPKELLL